MRELFKKLFWTNCFWLLAFIYIFVYRYLLEFGQVSYYLGYSALTDFFPTMRLRPNASCDDSFCQQRQAEARARPPKEQESVGDSKMEDKEVTHEDNEWGMCTYTYHEFCQQCNTYSCSRVKAGCYYKNIEPRISDEQIKVFPCI